MARFTGAVNWNAHTLFPNVPWASQAQWLDFERNCLRAGGPREGGGVLGLFFRRHTVLLRMYSVSYM